MHNRKQYIFFISRERNIKFNTTITCECDQEFIFGLINRDCGEKKMLQKHEPRLVGMRIGSKIKNKDAVK